MTDNGSDTDTECCDDCGQPVPIGAWPFCASEDNPKGHAKGSYQWGMAKMKAWERVSR